MYTVFKPKEQQISKLLITTSDFKNYLVICIHKETILCILKEIKNKCDDLHVHVYRFQITCIICYANPKSVNTRLISTMLLRCMEKANQIQDEIATSCNDT